MKLETTDKPTIANDPFESWWYYQGLGLFDGKLTKNELRGAFAAGRLGEFEGEATELKKERDTLLARNEELEQALREAPGVLAGLLDIARSEGFRCDDLQCGCPVGQGHKLAATLKALINGEEK